MLDRHRTMILKISHTFCNPGRAAIHALPCPLTDKAETAEYTSGLHGGKALPVPPCYLRQRLFRREQFDVYHHKVFPDRLGFHASHAPDDDIGR